MSEKRRDNKNRILRMGEQQRADGRYLFSTLDPISKKRIFVYSWKLERHDKMPEGKKADLSLREKEKLLERDLANGISLSGGDMTVLELVEKYLEQKRNVRPTTAAGYKTVVNVLKRDSFGSQKINHINTIDAKAWLIKLQSEDGKSYSSIHTIRGVVRPAFQMAYEADLIRKNPFDFELHNFLIDDSVKRDAVTSKQEKEFLRFVQQDEHFSECYDGMFILFRTGLRIGEFCGLTLKDIDLERRTINVNHQLQYVGNRGKYIEKTKTEAGTRVLPMSDEVYAAFKRVVQNRKKPKVEEMIDGYTGFLFLDKRGKPMTPHVCRHTFCTNAAKRGISVETLKYLMGHTDISVTSNVYTHLKLEDAQREMERLERIEKEMKKCAK